MASRGQYIYRGLYAAQLFHCFKSIPREKVLVIDSAALKSRPLETMRQVHQHLGIADYDYPSIMGFSAEMSGSLPDSTMGTSEQQMQGQHHSETLFQGDTPAARLKSAFDEFYPSFESRTGWRMEGNYQPIPRDLESALKRFYAPFNGMLFGMLGTDFDWK